MDTTIWIVIGIAHLVALADIWTSRLTINAKVLWSLTLVFLFGVGMGAWLLTRHSAHEEARPLPASAD